MTRTAPTALWHDPLAALALVTSLLTATSTAAQPLSLDDCIRIAFEHNPRIASAADLERAASARLEVARAAWLPRVDLHATARYDPLNGYDPDLTDGGEYAGQLVVQQALYDGGARRLSVRQAGVDLEKASSEQALARADLRLDVRLAYIDLLGARRQRALVDESITDLEAYLATVRALARGGAVPTTDVGRVEIELETEAASRSDIDIASAAAFQQLLEHLGLPPDAELALGDTVELPQQPERFDPGRSPDLAAAAFGIESGDIATHVAAAERLPAVALFGSVGAWTSRRQLVETDDRHILGYEAGVTLDMPVWSWGAIGARVAAQRAEVDGLRHDAARLQRHLEGEFVSDQRRLAVTREKWSRLDAALEQAQGHETDLRTRYAGGVASSLDVIDAHRQLLEIARERATTRSQIEALQASLLRSIEEGS